jgi:tRNA(Ile)-lysidine synthase
VLRKALEKLSKSSLNLDYKDFIKINKLLYNKGKIEIRGGIEAVSASGKLVFLNKKPLKPYNIKLNLNGDTLINGLLFRAKILYNIPVFKGEGTACLDLDKISKPVSVRTRRNGDRFYPLGMEKSKKLQDFFVDMKVPGYNRGEVPILSDSKGRIIWIAGLRIDDRFKVTPKTSRVLQVKFIKEQSSI